MKNKINQDTLNKTTKLFKVFANKTRIRILYSLYESEKSVSEIANELSMSQSSISHQLRVLKDGKLVKNQREGKTIYYSLTDNHIYNIISQGLQHINN